VISDAAGNVGFIKEVKKMKTGTITKFTIPANGGLVIQIKN
jgi:hypothetical protein